MKTTWTSWWPVAAGLLVVASACGRGGTADKVPSNGSAVGGGDDAQGRSGQSPGSEDSPNEGGVGTASGSGGGSGSGSGSGSSPGNGSTAPPDGSAGDAGAESSPGACHETLPAMSDYSKNGPFATTEVDNTGPSGSYTVVQPMPLGQNGFKHPIATWGNGITTTPSDYPTLLAAFASNGFVVIASNSTSVTTQDMTDGLDWMIQQDTQSGPYQGMLDTTCLVAIGYSLGGGAAVGAGAHANIVTTVSFHGVTGNSAALKTPLLLFTSTTDTFVTASGFVTPTFDASTVKTFYATLTAAGDPSDLGHLLPVSLLEDSTGGPERAPAQAWLRWWVYGDQGGSHYFDGASATLCQSPWTCQSKEPGGAAQMSGF
jgi:hypothetical protein